MRRQHLASWPLCYLFRSDQKYGPRLFSVCMSCQTRILLDMACMPSGGTTQGAAAPLIAFDTYWYVSTCTPPGALHVVRLPHCLPRPCLCAKNSAHPHTALHRPTAHVPVCHGSRRLFGNARALPGLPVALYDLAAVFLGSAHAVSAIIVLAQRPWGSACTLSGPGRRLYMHQMLCSTS